jgi:hypothetical protein
VLDEIRGGFGHASSEARNIRRKIPSLDMTAPRRCARCTLNTRARQSLAKALRSQRNLRARPSRKPAVEPRNPARWPRRACEGCRAQPGATPTAPVADASTLACRPRPVLAQGVCPQSERVSGSATRPSRVANKLSAGAERRVRITLERSRVGAPSTNELVLAVGSTEAEALARAMLAKNPTVSSRSMSPPTCPKGPRSNSW